MKRRTFLAAAVMGAVSGCLSTAGSGRFSQHTVPYEIRDVNATTEKLHPTHEYHFPYVSYIYELDDDDESEKEPIDYDELDPELQAAIRQIIEENPPTGYDDPPDGLLETIEQHVISCPAWCDTTHEYVELDYVEANPDAALVVDFAAEGTENQDGINLSLTNTDNESITAFSGEVPPFGILRGVGTGDTVHSFYLWNDGYEAGHIQIKGDRIIHPDDIKSIEIAGGEKVTRTYELSSRVADQFVPGEYVLSTRADATQYLFGQQIDVPLIISYDSPARPAGEIPAFEVEFTLVEE